MLSLPGWRGAALSERTVAGAGAGWLGMSQAMRSLRLSRVSARLLRRSAPRNNSLKSSLRALGSALRAARGQAPLSNLDPTLPLQQHAMLGRERHRHRRAFLEQVGWRAPDDQRAG